MQRINCFLCRVGLLVVFCYRAASPAFYLFSQMFGLPCQCRFPISCSEYAVQELKAGSSIVRALRNIFFRLISCSPISHFLKKGSQLG